MADQKPRFRSPIAQLQSSIGNHAVQRLLHSEQADGDLPQRSRLEEAFGVDFSNVRVQLGFNRELDRLGANAATVGEDVAFADRQPDIGLVAHELAHVVQQRRASGRDDSGRIDRSSALELEADRAAHAVLSGQRVPALGRFSPNGMQLDDKEKPRPILFVGVTENARKEAQALTAANLDRGGVQTITTTTPQDVLVADDVSLDLSTTEGIEIFAQSLGLTPDNETKVIGMLRSAGGGGLDELAALIKFYAVTDAAPDVPRMTRVVISGHSGGFSVIGEGGSLDFEALVELAQIYPNAAGQVEHLHVAGCSTGGEVTMEDYYLKAFPNVRTIWAYPGAAPSGTGAVSHLETWEKATEQAGVDTLKAPWNVATRSGGKYHASESLNVEQALAQVSAQQALFDDYFGGSKVDADPESGALTAYYRQLVRVAARTGVPVDERTRLREQQRVVLRLRFYSNVAKHFMTEHGSEIKAAYDTLTLAMPDYSKLSRKDALAAIHDFMLAAEDNGSAMPALDLLSGLETLSPDVIEESWILP